MSGTAPEASERQWSVGTAPGIFPFLGHGIALFRQPLAFLNSLPAHGDLVEIRLGPRPAWVVCHPELVRRMLRDSRTFDKGGPLYDRLRAVMGDGVVTCTDAEHQRQRRMVQPAFRPAHMAEYTALMAEEAESLCHEWRAGRRADVSADLLGLTTKVISRVLFSDSLDAATAAEFRACLAAVVRGLFVRTALPVDALFRVPTPANRRYRHAVGRLHTIVDTAIAERRRSAARDDLLGTLLDAARDDGDEPAVTDQEVHDQLVSLLLAGAESPSMCLASALDLLARHPEVERRLHAEADAVLDGRPRFEPADVPRLVHTRSVITETLRLRPPGWLFTRVTARETSFAGCRLPRGSTVLYSPYLLHRDPASFDEPERFLPERWLPGREAHVRQGAMIPFAAGRRKCLGDTFSMAETTVVLATIAAHWSLRPAPGALASPRPAVTLGPRPLVMTCAPRAGRPARTPPRHRAPRTTGTPRVPDSRSAGGNGVDDT